MESSSFNSSITSLNNSFPSTLEEKKSDESSGFKLLRKVSSLFQSYKSPIARPFIQIAIGNVSEIKPNPSELNKLKAISGSEKVSFKTADGSRLSGMYFKAKNAKKTLLLNSGTGESFEDFLGPVIRELHKKGFNVLAYNYRGFPGSEGLPSARGILEDADAAFNYLITEKKIQKEQIVAWGYSLGGAPAAYLAKKHSCPAVLDRPFTSSHETAESSAVEEELAFLPKVFRMPLALLAKKIFQITVPLDNVKMIQKTSSPIFMIRETSENVPMISEKNKERMLKKLKEKQIVYHELQIYHFHTEKSLTEKEEQDKEVSQLWFKEDNKKFEEEKEALFNFLEGKSELFT